MKRDATAAQVEVHDGPVVHVMDHYVMEVGGASGVAGYLTVYDLTWMPEVGRGTVALARMRLPDGRDLNVAGAQDPELARRMQQRLKGVFAGLDDRGDAGSDKAASVDHQRRPSIELDLDVAPQPMDLRRCAEGVGDIGWRMTAMSASGGVSVEAWWRRPTPPSWMSAPAGSLHPTRSITATMVSYDDVSLVVDGVSVPARPLRHDWWSAHLERPWSSAHVAFAETAITDTSIELTI